MKKMNSSVDGIKIGLSIAVLSALTGGCEGFVGGGYDGGGVVAPAPDVVLSSGTYDRGGDVHPACFFTHARCWKRHGRVKPHSKESAFVLACDL